MVEKRFHKIDEKEIETLKGKTKNSKTQHAAPTPG